MSGGRQSSRKGSSVTKESLFRPSGYFMVRAPAFPIEDYLRLGDPCASQELSPDNPRALLAIATGSLSLLEEIERQTLSRRDALRSDRKLLRYFIRMSSRPTPYGAFAGVALGHLGDATDLLVADSTADIRARLDMGRLMLLIWGIERQTEVRHHLRYMANTSAYLRGGRIYLRDRSESMVHTKSAKVSLSVRATGGALRALEFARQPIPYDDLIQRLLDAIPGATPEKVDRLLTELWQHTLLITDLRPSITGNIHPARRLQQRLSEIPQTAALAAEMRDLIDAIDAWSTAPLEHKVRSYRTLVAQIEQFYREQSALFDPIRDSSSLPSPEAEQDGEAYETRDEGAARSTAVLQVDAGMALARNHLAASVAQEVARMAETVLRLTAMPEGPTEFVALRRAFLEKYGEDREVPLVELLDPSFGLRVSSESTAREGHDQHEHRDRILTELAVAAQQTHQLTLDIEEKLLNRIATWQPDLTKAPASLDINIFIAARSPEDIDAGRYQLILGPNLGGQQAGRNFGRFAYLFGEDGASLRETAEQIASQQPDHIEAELVYLPSNDRMLNITFRPVICDYEICAGITPGVAPENMIPLDELVVGLRNNRFFLRWPRKQMYVMVRSGHMLNNRSAPLVVRFLDEISLDGTALLTGFDWGSAGNLPFLPRVQIGRFVLSLARWRLTTATRERELPAATPEAFQAALPVWRGRWNVPRYVYLTYADNRLLLDFENPLQSEELRVELQKLAESASLNLQEVFPALDQAWVRGPDGHYLTEFIFSLVRRGLAQAETASPRESVRQPDLPVITIEQRLKPLGSDWLFVKLYCGRDVQDDLIAGPMREFARDILKEQLADEWFFIRYTDPDPHLRLRFHGDPQRLLRKLLPIVTEWGTWLMKEGPCLHYVFDAYDREIERYGGPAGIEPSEALFAADSHAVADLLALMAQLDLDRTTLAVLTIDDLLASLGLDATQRLAWCHQRVTDRHKAGEAFRQKSAQLRDLLGMPERTLLQISGGADVLETLTRRRSALAEVRDLFAQGVERGELIQPLDRLCGNFVHMHCIRLIGLDRTKEEEAVGLLLRTHESLYRAPV